MAAVMIIDDTEDCRRPLALLLKARGHFTQLAENGQDAFLTLQAGYRPDVILLDLAMPVMDGLSFLRKLRATGRWATLPVIVVSGESKTGPIREAKELGANAVFVKGDFDASELFDAIDAMAQSQPV